VPTAVLVARPIEVTAQNRPKTVASDAVLQRLAPENSSKSSGNHYTTVFLIIQL